MSKMLYLPEPWRKLVDSIVGHPQRHFVRVLCRPNPDHDEYAPLIFDCEVEAKDRERLKGGTLPLGFQGKLSTDEHWAFEMDQDGTIDFAEPGWDPTPTTFLSIPRLVRGARFTTIEDGENWAYLIREIAPLPRDRAKLLAILPRR